MGKSSVNGRNILTFLSSSNWYLNINMMLSIWMLLSTEKKRPKKNY